MPAGITVTAAELPEVLLHVAVVRPVFLWGAPGIGKSSLVRLVHIRLRASASDWLHWAGAAGIHPWVVDYLRNRPDHLWTAPPKTEEPFSTPRSWHMLSDALHSYGDGISDETLRVLAFGTLSAAHASAFRAFVKTVRNAFGLDAVLKGETGWPAVRRTATCSTSLPRPSGRAR
jgi:hypothetical protein